MDKEVQLQLIALLQQVLPMILTGIMGWLLPQPKAKG